MEEHVEKTSRKVDRAERDLAVLAQAKEPAYTGLEPALVKFRDASQDLFFLDLHVFVSKDVENRLWAGHQKANQFFRQYLGSLRREENRKKTVERRKAEKLYLDFIKSSQRFYRGFIQRVCSHFNDVSEIYTVARKMHLDTTSVDTPVEIDPSQKHQLIRSCHMALIQCGDLSRYREIELSHKERNWGPAKGYYECAAELDPTSGHSFNQLSVMALADGDHFRALFYVYRCLAMPKRFPNAPGNLMSELKKLRNKNYSSAKLDTKLGDSEVPFLKYHGKSYADGSFPDMRAELDDLLSMLSAAVVSKPCNVSLRKMCLINISASKHAIDSAREPPLKEVAVPAEKYAEAWNRLQCLNIAYFATLLRLLSNELLRIATEIGGRLSNVTESIARLTPVCRRVLPCLRLYSAWLLTDLEMLHKSEACGNSLGLQLLWPTYAECLSYLSELFPLDDVLDVPYLLEEEQDTVHFTPFDDCARKFLHLDGDGGYKPYREECKAILVADAQRPDMEMLFRIKGLLRIGAHLVKHSTEFGPIAVPLVFEDNQFEYRLAMQTPDRDTHVGTHDTDADEPHMNGTMTEFDSRIARTVTDNMEDMVDDLVGAEPAAANARSTSRVGSSGLHDSSSKENSRPVSSTFTASDLVRQISQGSPAGIFSTPIQQHGHRASFGLSQDPFAPLPGDLGGSVSGSRPGTSHQNASPRLGNHRSSGFFNDEIAKRQRAIEERSSPLLSMEQSTTSNTPSGLYTLAQNRSRPSLQQSQWQPPFSSSAADIELTRKPPTPSRFGAIGDSRPKGARTPTSGQPG